MECMQLQEDKCQPGLMQLKVEASGVLWGGGILDPLSNVNQEHPSRISGTSNP
jgi:hypothetical protein